jgi:hypothetical protein
MNNADDQNVNKIIATHYNQQTKQIFDFLSDFMTNKFYNIVFELAKKYTIKNGFSISDNYKNIFDSYMDTLSINSREEEVCKNQMFSVFLNHLYDCYTKYVNNQIISINDFIISVNIAFLPDNYKNDTYIQNKQNLSILFHTLIYNLSKELYIYINNHMDHIILYRIKENEILLRKECIKSLSVIRNELFIKFEQQDNDINTGVIENDIILNSDIYKGLVIECKSSGNKIVRLKKGIIQMLEKEKNYKRDISKLLNLINALTQKLNKHELIQNDNNKSSDNGDSYNKNDNNNKSGYDEDSYNNKRSGYNDDNDGNYNVNSDSYNDDNEGSHNVNSDSYNKRSGYNDDNDGSHNVNSDSYNKNSEEECMDLNKQKEQMNLNKLFNESEDKSDVSNYNSDDGSSLKHKSQLESLFSN